MSVPRVRAMLWDFSILLHAWEMLVLDGERRGSRNDFRKIR